MNAFRLLPLSIALCAALALPAQAQSLVALYESARAYDASYQSVKSLYDSTLAKSEQARAGLLHTIGLSANASLSTIDNTLARSKQGFYDTQSATLSASKPLYRPANQITFNQSRRQIEVVEQQMMAAEQDLIVKVSTAYFDSRHDDRYGPQLSLACIVPRACTHHRLHRHHAWRSHHLVDLSHRLWRPRFRS